MKNPKTDDLQTQLKEVTENWKRALADYQNLEKRSQNEKEEFARFANRELIFKILPILDTFEQLEKHLDDSGLHLAIKQLRDLLKSEGLEKIEVLGKDYHPEEMEGIEIVPGDEDNKVMEETRTGYRFKGKILRAAQVKVSKKTIN
ncbi:MAG: nucleotide exchange factor GrpE [Patescibacteria group bacterium]|nr:nucleotide exchange factor GrpE [Patescibacteria group bacterium]MCL5095920.1 nucleotide exchange factor GrpE [Patescibacteria group bacterium]